MNHHLKPESTSDSVVAWLHKTLTQMFAYKIVNS